MLVLSSEKVRLIYQCVLQNAGFLLFALRFTLISLTPCRECARSPRSSALWGRVSCAARFKRPLRPGSPTRYFPFTRPFQTILQIVVETYYQRNSYTSLFVLSVHIIAIQYFHCCLGVHDTSVGTPERTSIKQRAGLARPMLKCLKMS